MIYTVTLNPALDYIISVPDFRMGMTNRIQTEQMLPGGKGLNVSIVLHNLGIKNLALGFIAGFTGEEIKRRFEILGGTQEFITLKQGCSRINIKMKSADGTEINGIGPEIDSDSLDQLWSQLEQLKSGDVLVLSGNVPASLSSGIYRDIMVRLRGKGILTVVDTTKDYLMGILEEAPFLIKPNVHELEEIFGTEIQSCEQIVVYAKELQKMGARNVLISMGGDGAVLLDEKQQIHRASAPKGTLINSIGAGDSMVAGFISSWFREQDYRTAFKMGVASGSASAFSEGLGQKETILKLYEEIECERRRWDDTGVI